MQRLLDFGVLRRHRDTVNLRSLWPVCMRTVLVLLTTRQRLRDCAALQRSREFLIQHVCFDCLSSYDVESGSSSKANRQRK